MTTLELTSNDMAELMGVNRQAIDEWLSAGPPVDRCEKINTISEIADTLRYRLHAGVPAVVARHRAEAYGNRTMLELITADEHDWLLHSIKQSFDFSASTFHAQREHQNS